MNTSKSTPLVSIITPVFNAERFLLQTISSVQAQSYNNYEHLLVMDANSKDSSVTIALSSQTQDSRIKTIQNPRAQGAAINRNIGIDSSRGEYLAFLDADDLWPPGKLERQVQFSLEKQSPFTFTSFRRMSEDGLRISEPTTVASEVDYYDLLKLNVIALHTVLLRRDFVGDRRFPNVVHEDFAFWLELLRPCLGLEHDRAFGLNEPLAFYRNVPGSRAFDKKKAALWRWKILRDYEKLPLMKAFYYFCEYAIRASILHKKTKV